MTRTADGAATATMIMFNLFNILLFAFLFLFTRFSSCWFSALVAFCGCCCWLTSASLYQKQHTTQNKNNKTKNYFFFLICFGAIFIICVTLTFKKFFLSKSFTFLTQNESISFLFILFIFRKYYLQLFLIIFHTKDETYFLFFCTRRRRWPKRL